MAPGPRRRRYRPNRRRRPPDLRENDRIRRPVGNPGDVGIGELLPGRIEIGSGRRRGLGQEKRVRRPVGDRHPDRNGPAVAAVVSDPEADLLFDKRQNRECLAYRNRPNAAVTQHCNAAVAQVDGQVPTVWADANRVERIGCVPYGVPCERIVIDRPAGKGGVAGRDDLRTLPSPNSPSSKPPFLMRLRSGRRTRS